MISFEEALCGHYTNKAQATSDPQKWPWVNIEWTEIKKGKILECKSWYEYEGCLLYTSPSPRDED